MAKEFKSESRLSFIEATSIIVGHGVGAGILSVPYLASRNSWISFVFVIIAAYLINFLMHLMIAELSYNNGGAQFIQCLEKDLFGGKTGKYIAWFAFLVLGLSEIVKVSGFITGAAAVFTNWFGWPSYIGVIVYYVIAAFVVFLGMKVVGICEKISVFSMIAVIGILLVATLGGEVHSMPSETIAPTNILALYSMVAFALSAVMSVPQVVKGLNGDVKKIRGSIALGSGVNLFLVVIITFMTIAGAGKEITSDGALVDLSSHLGGWVSIVGYIFTLLALSTSLWACTLNLRDIVHEQTKLGLKISWVIASLPCFILAITGLQSFVGFTRLSSAVTILFGISIIIAYSRSRKHNNGISPIVGGFGSVPFCVLIILGTLISTIGALISVK